MGVHLTTAVALRAAGPALFVLLGVAVLALSGRQKGRLAVGALLVATGGALVCTNLGIAGGGVGFYYAGTAFGILGAVAATAALLWPAASERLRPAWLAGIAAFAAAYAVSMVLVAPRLLAGNALYLPQNLSSHGMFLTYLRTSSPARALLFVLPIGWGLQARRAAPVDMRLLAGLSAGLLAWLGYNTGTDGLSGDNVVFVWVPWLAGPAVLAAAVVWLRVGALNQSKAARNVALLALTAMFLGMLRHVTSGIDSIADPAPVGLARLVGWGILAWTIVHAGWLDVRFLSRHRAGVGAAGLAVLFIVAQVAQNYFAAEYGLLMGGIVAGTLVFAASPIQRAIERSRERAGPVTPAVVVDRVPLDRQHDLRREALYKDAVRMALRDRRLTRDEEVRLHRLAEELGIGAGRAHELLVAIEAERSRKRKVP